MAESLGGPTRKMLSSTEMVDVRRRRKAVFITIFSLLLDLLAFTIPLPLFPRLVDHFLKKEAAHSTDEVFLSRLMDFVRFFRSKLTSLRIKGAKVQSIKANERWDIILLGGMLGSLFSLIQCIVSPKIGSLSDTYGRRPILIATMLGNILSGLVWLKSTTFATYLGSRIIGACSEANVQLSIAIISDVSPPQTRARSLALVGLSFSLAFTFGPLLGAYFAARPLTSTVDRVNIYAYPAAITVVLLTVETLMLIAFLPETRTMSTPAPSTPNTPIRNPIVAARKRSDRLKRLNILHFAFLFVFGGVEFVLTFLSYDLFAYTNLENGRLLGTIGLTSALIQGGFVRRLAPKLGSARIARSGILACALAIALMATLPIVATSRGRPQGEFVLYLAGLLLAYTSATVVTSLTALASIEAEGEVKGAHSDHRGAALGTFRSRGQLGRALGPMLITSLYWTLGPTLSFVWSGLAMLTVWYISRPLPNPVKERIKAA